MTNETGRNLKTIHSSLSMELIDEIMEFHSKGNICLDNHFASQIQPHGLSLSQLKSLERSDFEISPFYAESIVCDTQMSTEIARSPSATVFSQCKLPFSDIQKILKNSFAVRSDSSRPYPSGGALYPVEVICATYSDRLMGSPESGFYHYRPTLGLLQPIRKMHAKAMRDLIYKTEAAEVNSPHFTLIYISVIGKMLVKYKYRGYRYALMEAGAMFHQADLVGKELGLCNKLYSAFNDYELMHEMGLNRMGFLPLVAQSFGV